MRGKLKPSAPYLIALVIFLILLSCEEIDPDDNVVLVYDTTYVPITTIQTTALFGVDEHWLPMPSADLLSITASGDGVADTTLHFSRAEMPSYFWVTVMESGTWTLTLQAYNSSMGLLVAEASQTFTQPLVNNVLTLTWDYLNDLVMFEDFSDDYSGWSGTANASILDSSLLIQSTGQTDWIYNIFDGANPGQYTSLTTRFDLKFYDSRSFIGFRAHATNGSLDWGPEVLFQSGAIIAHQHSGNMVASYQYDLDTWYEFQLTLDNSLGTIGRYMLEFRERGSTEFIDLGEYDYYSYDGRPVDMVQISFAVQEAEQGHGSLQVDNVLVLAN